MIDLLPHARYQCSECRRYFRPNKKGRFRIHYIVPNVPCPGSGEPANTDRIDPNADIATTISVAESVEWYARKLGKRRDELNDDDKAEAFRTYALHRLMISEVHSCLTDT